MLVAITGAQACLLKATVRCRAEAEAYQAALVGMGATIRCSPAMALLKVQVDILPVVKVVATPHTKLDWPKLSHRCLNLDSFSTISFIGSSVFTF